MGSGVVEARGVLDMASWKRCVLSQECRGEMKGMAYLGLNLNFAPFLLWNLVEFISLSEPQFPHLENEE